MQENPAHAFALLESDLAPGLAGIITAIQPATDRRAVARIRLARADPDGLGRHRMHSDGADRQHILLIEERSPRQPTIAACPEPAARASDVELLGFARHAANRRDAPTHRRRPDGPRLELREQLSWQLLRSQLERAEGGYREEEE
jgi:hypothetical protein